MYYRTGKAEWQTMTKFWMRLFGINFAVGVAGGLILEFQFGTNWSNYSWLVGDIFGAPLAIEGIMAFFLESTFFVIMENYAIKSEFLDDFAFHYLTGEKIPAEMIKRLKEADNYNIGYICLRQLNFGFIDMAWVWLHSAP